MFERRSGRLSVILENQDVFEPPILLQVKDTIAESPKHIFDSFWRKRGETSAVIGSFNDDFVGPHAVHPVEHTLGLAAQASLYAQGWKLIGNYAHRPSRRIALRRRPSVGIRTIGLNLRRCLALISITEGAEAPLQFHSITGKVSWSLGAVSRDNDPPAYDWVFSKLRQGLNPFNNGVSIWLTPIRIKAKTFILR